LRRADRIPGRGRPILSPRALSQPDGRQRRLVRGYHDLLALGLRYPGFRQKPDPHLLAVAPNDFALRLKPVQLDKKVECIGDAVGTVDLKACARDRQISHDARVGQTTQVECDRTALDYPPALECAIRIAGMFGHGFVPSVSGSGRLVRNTLTKSGEDECTAGTERIGAEPGQALSPVPRRIAGRD